MALPFSAKPACIRAVETSPVLLVERDGHVAILTLNRPEARNALSPTLVQELGQALERAAADSDVRVIVLTGAGGAFCAGADLKAAFSQPELMADLDARILEYHAMIRAIAFAPKPVIAAVDGGAVGFGCDLALACDLRILSTRAYLQEKFVKIGLMPDGGGTYWLPRLIGTARAMEYILTGAAIDAEKANAFGLANRVVAPENVMDEAMSLARELAKGPPIAMREAKASILKGLGSTLDAALDREREGQKRCLTSGDAMEGVFAWMQKREPQFKGQ